MARERIARVQLCVAESELHLEKSLAKQRHTLRPRRCSYTLGSSPIMPREMNMSREALMRSAGALCVRASRDSGIPPGQEIFPNLREERLSMVSE